MSPSAAAPRTLAEELRRRSDQQLADLFRTRPDIGIPAPVDTSQVASRAVTRVSVSRALDRLDSGQLCVLEALMVTDAPVTPAKVRRLVDAPRAYVDDSIAVLRELALVWGTQRALHVVRTVHDVLGPHPAGLGPPSPSLDAGRIADLIADASAERPDAAAVLDRLAWGPPTGVIGRSSETVQALVGRRLLIPVDDDTVALPREVGLHLRGGRTTREPIDRPPAIATVPRDAARIANAAAGAAFDVVRRVDQLLEHWSLNPPSVLRSGGVGVRDVREVGALLGVESADASYLVELAFGAGLLARSEDRELGHVWLPTNEYDGWRDEPLARQWSTLVRSWLTGGRLASLSGSRDEQGRVVNTLAYDLERPLAPSVRRLTLEIAGSVAPEAYASADDVVKQARWYRPRRNELRDDIVRASLAEAQVLGLIAAGCLSSPARELLNGADGADALAPLLPEPVDHLMIQADLTAVAPGPLERSVAASVGDIADIESRGGATVFRFTPASIRRALDRGWPADRIHSLVGELSITPVPQPLTYLIDDVARRHGRLRVGNASVYVRCDDPTELDALINNPVVESLRLRRIAPTVALSDAPADIVIDRLTDAGVPPVAEGMDGTLHVPEAERRRATGRPQPATSRAPGLSGDQIDRLVRAIRVGDSAADRRPVGGDQPSAAGTLAALRDAVESGSTVWLAYLDQAGTPSERVVDPIRVDAGWLTAYDHRSERAQSFAIHRIGKVSTRHA
ncbi:helicase-associated domain-containing protein [Solicola gregarius]|uniref:Helicase C-terminal domain-containing protein n=1 Tax=Solicola gregarius TaxID=2908642 RepID=A0AA46TJZ8_9ACTN|nr:helicase-associated domain-containing protein [Solicola gregarius]UYM06727.1 helicase C-terminal domain-containing protein [Solicola gregarius]